MFATRIAPLAAFVALALQGCARAPAGPRAELTTGTWDKYPTYEGSLTVGGTVLVTNIAGSDPDKGLEEVVSATLTGVDTACTGTQTGDGNRCGVHIHEGSTCTQGTGGHLFSGDTDPWVPVTYTDASSGDATVAGVTVATGYSVTTLFGKAMVVHDSTGARVACSILEAQECSPNCPWSASARAGTEQEAPGLSPLVFVGAMLVTAVLGGGAWYYQSLRRGYSTQQDEAVEVQSAAPKQDDSMEGHSAA